MKKRSKHALLALAVIVVLVSVIWFFGTQQTIILTSSDPNVVYHYAGTLPAYQFDRPTWQYYPGSREASGRYCAIPKEFFDARITSVIPTTTGGTYPLPEKQTITVGSNKYEFVVKNVRKGNAGGYELYNVPVTTCGVIVYEADVYKNGAQIDSIRFNEPKYCDGYGSTTVERDYGDVKAIFYFRGEQAGDRICGDPGGIYIINKYTIVAAQLSCPGGTTYNSATKLCEAPIYCPPGSTYNSQIQKCVYTPAATAVCQTGYTYDAASDKCQYTPPTAASCPSGTTFNSQKNVCEYQPDVVAKCDSGYTFNSATNKCEYKPESSASCPTKTTYNSATDRCEYVPESAVTCVSGYTYNSATDKCEYSPEKVILCPADSTYNSATNKCEAQITETEGPIVIAEPPVTTVVIPPSSNGYGDLLFWILAGVVAFLLITFVIVLVRRKR